MTYDRKRIYFKLTQLHVHYYDYKPHALNKSNITDVRVQAVFSAQTLVESGTFSESAVDAEEAEVGAAALCSAAIRRASS